MPKTDYSVGTIGYPCSGCGHTFDTAEDFTNHHARAVGGATIVGCKLKPAEAKKLRRP
jgi:hypothetical protein